jgi:uncharacterized protein DUF6249
VDDLSFPFFIPLMIFMIPIIAMLGGFVYLIVRTVLRNRVRELEIRERIAMIERGLVPAPEVDPRGFERAMTRHDTVVLRNAPTRSRSAGVIFMGIGAALMFLIGFAGGEPGAAIGVGGALIIIGLAFFLNGLMSGGRDLPVVERYVPAPPPHAPASPASAASQPESRRD